MRVVSLYLVFFYI